MIKKEKALKMPIETLDAWCDLNPKLRTEILKAFSEILEKGHIEELSEEAADFLDSHVYEVVEAERNE